MQQSKKGVVIIRIKLRKTDMLFTRIVRIIFKYTCQRCGKYYPPDGDLHNLGTSHYYVRNRENTRFLLANVTLLCNFPCHRKWEGEDRADYKEYMIKRLGQEGFDKVTLAANTYQKKDDVTTKIVLKQWLQELNGDEK